MGKYMDNFTLKNEIAKVLNLPPDLAINSITITTPSKGAVSANIDLLLTDEQLIKLGQMYQKFGRDFASH